MTPAQQRIAAYQAMKRAGLDQYAARFVLNVAGIGLDEADHKRVVAQYDEIHAGDPTLSDAEVERRSFERDQALVR